MDKTIILAMILLPVFAGLALPIVNISGNYTRRAIVSATLVINAALTVGTFLIDSPGFTLLTVTEIVSFAFRIDAVSRLFALLGGFGYLLIGIYSFEYIEHEGHENQFYAFFLTLQGILFALFFSANLITMYMCFELTTLLSMPLVLFTRTQESIYAALKYLYYSIAGALGALFGIFFLSRYATTLAFVPGGSLNPAVLAGHEPVLRAAIFVAVVGFGAKAGLYPLHGWLPAAHPVAPAPASALLSGIVAKAGILSIIRILYFVTGADFVRGTWVQHAWLGLAVLTVFLGSMMAYREKILKKRLAYSTVSQLSYILIGLFIMTPDGISGGLMHILFHAVIKIALFLVAGSIILKTRTIRTDEMIGFGKQMPVTITAYTLASLGLIGIPPFSGFISKWFLATASLESHIPVFYWLSPVILLISALLTAGYLLPITIHGFFPGCDFVPQHEKCDGSVLLWGPILILAILSLLLGVFSTSIAAWTVGIAGMIC